MRLWDLAPAERTQPLADLLDLGLGELRPGLGQGGRAAVHLGDPLLREGSVLDRLQDLAHVVAHVLVDDARPDGMRAVLRRVGDRVVHALDPALVDQVDDQLHLVQALVVGELRRVAGLAERLEAELDQLLQPAAEHRLRAHEDDPGRSPTITSTPESARLSACAWPWLPYPRVATFPVRRPTSPVLITSTISSFPSLGDGRGAPPRLGGAGAAQADPSGACQ